MYLTKTKDINDLLFFGYRKVNADYLNEMDNKQTKSHKNDVEDYDVEDGTLYDSMILYLNALHDNGKTDFEPIEYTNRPNQVKRMSFEDYERMLQASKNMKDKLDNLTAQSDNLKQNVDKNTSDVDTVSNLEGLPKEGDTDPNYLKNEK